MNFREESSAENQDKRAKHSIFNDQTNPFTMKAKYLFLLLPLVTVFLFESCLKKGEDDPFLSLHSRKGRVAGEWKVTSYLFTDRFVDGSGNIYITDLKMENGEYSKTVISPLDTVVTSGTMTWEWKIRRDGTYEYDTKTDGLVYHSTGLWNFTAGVGKYKTAYYLRELRNDKMVWYYNVADENINTISSDVIEITFEAVK